jgi:hypothetical protein
METNLIPLRLVEETDIGEISNLTTPTSFVTCSTMPFSSPNNEQRTTTNTSNNTLGALNFTSN